MLIIFYIKYSSNKIIKIYLLDCWSCPKHNGWSIYGLGGRGYFEIENLALKCGVLKPKQTSHCEIFNKLNKNKLKMNKLTIQLIFVAIKCKY